LLQKGCYYVVSILLAYAHDTDTILAAVADEESGSGAAAGAAQE